MAEHSLWRFSRALHRAINDRQFGDIEAVIDDDVDWVVHGPTDIFPYLGARHGKHDVLETIRQISDTFKIRRFERETVVLGVDCAASMLRCSLTVRGFDKPMSLRAAQFAHFKAGQLVGMRVLVDTLDLVEQALDQHIQFPNVTAQG
ncbi:nuclear transport factor 2 family protein [Bradyrhizobium glycinis]|uniref:nuclear transport factor 2 family protein n=1 Tax=Bradyrhizobium glycinis TaxID=2751812 RepID=UPI0018D65658|nr:nuclear transport factor 2 family protein [Bradyrhizobium glycinis]MBH5371514.1 nuclear transport factor 2 family protein [Bradyrhizobium glycinis]